MAARSGPRSKVGPSLLRVQATGSRFQSEGVRAGGAGGEKSVARLQALEEDLVSRDKAHRRGPIPRLAELEKSIKELQRLVELKSQGMAQMQSGSASGSAAASRRKGSCRGTCSCACHLPSLKSPSFRRSRSLFPSRGRFRRLRLPFLRLRRSNRRKFNLP